MDVVKATVFSFMIDTVNIVHKKLFTATRDYVNNHLSFHIKLVLFSFLSLNH